MRYERDPESGLIVPRRRIERVREHPSMLPYFQQGQFGRAQQGSSSSSDPFFADVRLLLLGEGTPGSTTFTDSSSYARSISILHGSPTITTGNFQQGAASINFPGGAVIGLSAASDDFRIDNPAGSGSFGSSLPVAVDFWVRCTNTSPDPQFIFDTRDAGGIDSWAIAKESGKWGFYGGSAGFIYSSASVAADTWTHVAVSRAASSSLWRLYVDGVQQATLAANLSRGYIRVGGRGGGDFTFTGQVDALRFTMADRYPDGTSFTPPTTY